MDYADLAEETGLAIVTLYNLACGNNRSQKGRNLVEGVFGVPIWPREKRHQGGNNTITEGGLRENTGAADSTSSYEN